MNRENSHIYDRETKRNFDHRILLKCDSLSRMALRHVWAKQLHKACVI